MIQVDSSVIEAVDYKRGLLKVKFKVGCVYHYAGVPKATWVAFMEASSKGRYFNDHIKGKYPSKRAE